MGLWPVQMCRHLVIHWPRMSSFTSLEVTPPEASACICVQVFLPFVWWLQLKAGSLPFAPRTSRRVLTWAEMAGSRLLPHGWNRRRDPDSTGPVTRVDEAPSGMSPPCPRRWEISLCWSTDVLRRWPIWLAGLLGRGRGRGDAHDFLPSQTWGAPSHFLTNSRRTRSLPRADSLLREAHLRFPTAWHPPPVNDLS